MAPSSKNKKKKAKAKHGKKNHSNNDISPSRLPTEMNAEVFDSSEEYPTSRVIKSGPNGDVIVESITSDDDDMKHKKKNDAKDNTDNMNNNEPSTMASVLDNHWETLSPEIKKRILRIDKNEVFYVIQKYQSTHNCNCTVCGRRHMSMDQEMERIYNTLYEIDKVKDPEINPVKFHLGIIKELQLSRHTDENNTEESPSRVPHDDTLNGSTPIKSFIPSSNVESLKEEVMHFKQNRQRKYIDDESSNQNKGQLNTEDEENVLETKQNAPQIALAQQYKDFTKNFISSHPKLASEYVNKMMLYPDMLNVTNNMMGIGSDKNFVATMTDFVAQKLKNGADEINKDGMGDPKVFTTMLHNGTPLTPDEYIELQRNIADRMTNSYDTKKREFNSISPLEKELFVRFMLSDNRKQFEDIVMQSFREKFDYEFGGSSISASLAAAAAAATLTNPLSALNSTQDSTKFHNYDARNDVSDDEYEYSDYDDEEEEEDDDEHGGSGILSDYLEDEDETHPKASYDEDGHFDANDHMMKHHPEHLNYTPQPNNGNFHQYLGSDEFEEDGDSYDDDEEEAEEEEFEGEEEEEEEGEDNDIGDEEDGYESPYDEAERLEEGRKLLQIAITKLLQGRILESYHESEAENNRLKLLKELEDEQKSKEEKKQKKQKKKEKEKEKKKQQQLAKEEEKRKKIDEEERIKKENEARELERREAQRKKVEEVKRKKDEEKRRKLEEQRKREELQERQRKLKEEQKRKREEEKKKKEEEKKKSKESKRQIQSEETSKNLELERQSIQAPLSQTDDSLPPLKQSNITKESNISSNILEPPKFESVSNDISDIISSVTAFKSISESPSHLQNLLHPQIPTMGTPVSKTARSSIDQTTNPLALDANQLFPTTNSLLSTPVLPTSRQNEFDNLYSSLSNNPPPALAGLPGSNMETPLWNSYSSPSISQAIGNPMTQTDPLAYRSVTGTPQARLASYNQIANTNQSKQSFTDELNSLTNMLSYSGLNEPNFTTSSADQMWNNGQRNSTSARIATQPMSNLNTSGSSLHNSVPSTAMHQFMDTNSARSGSIWNNSIIDQSNQTPLASSTNNTSRVGANTMNRPLQDQTTDVSNLLPSSIWNEPSPTFMNTNTNMVPQTSNNNIFNKEQSISDMIYKECNILQQQDPLQQPYILTELLFHRIAFLGLDYNTFMNILLNMRSNYGVEAIPDVNGTISHIMLSKSTMMPSPPSIADISLHPQDPMNLANDVFKSASVNTSMGNID